MREDSEYNRDPTSGCDFHVLSKTRCHRRVAIDCIAKNQTTWVINAKPLAAMSLEIYHFTKL